MENNTPRTLIALWVKQTTKVNLNDKSNSKLEFKLLN